MISDDTPAARASALLEERLGLRGPDLERQLRKAGRRLPRRIRQDGETIATAQRFAAHPRMARRIDQGTVDRAHGRFTRHLEAIDRREVRRTRAINLAALVAAQVLIVAVLFVAVLAWRGLV